MAKGDAGGDQESEVDHEKQEGITNGTNGEKFREPRTRDESREPNSRVGLWGA